MEQAAVAEELRSRHDALIDAMLASTEQGPDGRQYVSGFLAVVEAAAAGDTTPRDDYLAAVIPPTKASGMSLAVVMAGMVGVTAGLASGVSPGALPWVARFLTDYTKRLCAVWEAS